MMKKYADGGMAKMKKVAKKEVETHVSKMHKGVPKRMANGGMAGYGPVKKMADGGMAGGCGHRSMQDYGK